MHMTPPQPELDIVVCRLPDSLPFAMPLPVGARVVGTIVNPGGLERFSIYMDAPQSPEQVLASYRESLLSIGWFELNTGGRRGGFHNTDPELDRYAQFCQSERGPGLFVHAVAGDGSPTEAQLSVYVDGRSSPCTPRPHRGMPDSPIPALAPPRGARFAMGSFPAGGVGPDGAASGIEFQTDLDLTTVASHYDKQLQGGGWTYVGSDEDRLAHWSTWSFEHEDGSWRGLFIVFRRPDIGGRYLLQVKAERLPES
jgi:hypothetical protein